MTGGQLFTPLSTGFVGSSFLKKMFPKPKSPIKPKDPDPTPTALMTEETQAAKRKVSKRKRGRPSTILAGRMMAGRKEILKTKVGE